MININEIKPTAKFIRITSEFEQDGNYYALYKSLTMAINLTSGTYFEAFPGVFVEVLGIEYSYGNTQITVSYRHDGKTNQKILSHQEEIWIAWIEEV